MASKIIAPSALVGMLGAPVVGLIVGANGAPLQQREAAPPEPPSIEVPEEVAYVTLLITSKHSGKAYKEEMPLSELPPNACAYMTAAIGIGQGVRLKAFLKMNNEVLFQGETFQSDDWKGIDIVEQMRLKDERERLEQNSQN
jgi:hypothetical protein